MIIRTKEKHGERVIDGTVATLPTQIEGFVGLAEATVNLFNPANSDSHVVITEDGDPNHLRTHTTDLREEVVIRKNYLPVGRRTHLQQTLNGITAPTEI